MNHTHSEFRKQGIATARPPIPSFRSTLVSKPSAPDLSKTTRNNRRSLKQKNQKSSTFIKNKSSKNSSLEIKPKDTMFRSYFLLNKFALELVEKIPNLGFLSKTGLQIHLINKFMKKNGDVYEKIRVYADMAQELEFDSFHQILGDKDGQALFSKILKLERWGIIVIFYFKVVKANQHKLNSLLRGLSELVWTNQQYLVKWIGLLEYKYGIGWEVDGGEEGIYEELDLDYDGLIVQIVNTCQLILSYLKKM
jgi:hypothetical protein